MYRIIGHYPVISPTVVVIGNQSAVDGRWLGAPPGNGGLEVGGGDEGADFGVQVKAELDLYLIGGLGHRQSRVMIAWRGFDVAQRLQRFSWLVRSPGRRRGPG